MRHLRKQLLVELSEVLRPLGFRRVEQTFWRDFPAGRDAFHVAFIRHPTDFDVTADVAIRYEALEALLNAQRPYLSTRQKRQTATIGAQVANLAGVGMRRWGVSGPADLPRATAGLLRDFYEVGEPFFARFRSLAELGRTLRSDPVQARLLCPLPGSLQQVLTALCSLPPRAV